MDGLFIENKKCSAPDKIFAVKGFVLGIPYNPMYANQQSLDYISFVQELERLLLAFYRKSSARQGLKEIQIDSLRNGSTIVDYSVLYQGNKNVNAQQVENIARLASNDSDLGSLNPDNSRLATAQGEFHINYLSYLICG